MDNKQNKAYSTLANKILIAKKLEEVCTKTIDGFAKYASGWNDRKVADLLGKSINANHVRHVRQEIVGNTERTAKPKIQPPISLSDLETRITQIEDYLTSKNPTWKGSLI